MNDVCLGQDRLILAFYLGHTALVKKFTILSTKPVLEKVVTFDSARHFLAIFGFPRSPGRNWPGDRCRLVCRGLVLLHSPQLYARWLYARTTGSVLAQAPRWTNRNGLHLLPRGSV